MNLDAASGQPLNPAAREAWLTMADAGWADPRRLYREGRRAAMLRDAAREALASRLGVRPTELSVTTSGPEALRTAIQALLRGRSGPIVASAVEHSAILEEADARGGARIVPVDGLGRVSLTEFEAALPGAAVACLQDANQEVGTGQPWQAAAAAAEVAEVPLLVDATMSLGHRPPPTAATMIVGEALSWGGPAGVGLLAATRATGGTGARGTRVRGPALGPATDTLVSIPLLVAAARGLEWAEDHRERQAAWARGLTERLWREIPACAPDVAMLGDSLDRLPHLVAFTALYVDGEALVLGLDAAGFAVSSGSACVADTRRPSHVLTAMGAMTHGNVRVSLPYSDEVDVDRQAAQASIDGFLAALPRVIADARAFLEGRAP